MYAFKEQVIQEMENWKCFQLKEWIPKEVDINADYWVVNVCYSFNYFLE